MPNCPFDQKIVIPSNPPDPLKMQPGDVLEIYFTQPVFLWNSDPGEFNPSLVIGLYQSGDTWCGTAKNTDTVQYGWFPAQGWLPPGNEREVYLESAPTQHGMTGSGAHTIQIGQSGLGLGKVQKIKNIISSDEKICKVWPSVEEVIELLLKEHWTPGVQEFLEALRSAGNDICPRAYSE